MLVELIKHILKLLQYLNYTIPEAEAACLLSVIDIPPLLLPNEICLKAFYKLTPQNKHTHTQRYLCFLHIEKSDRCLLLLG